MALMGALIALALVVGCRRLGLRRAVATVVALTVAGTAPLLLGPTAGAYVAATVPLGTAADFSVLAGSTVTNTGDSVLQGSIGLDPGTSVTGFPPGQVLPPATIQIDNPVTETAKADLVIAYDDAAGRSVDETTTADLSGLQLVGGVYAGPGKGALSLSGSLVLDGQNDPSSVFIFQTDSTLTTATGSTITLINGAQECNVFWQVGSSATLGTSSVFRGTILARASVTVPTSAVVHGRALARTAAVTLDSNVFALPTCDLTVPTTTTAVDPGGTTTTAAPGGTTTTAAPGTTTTVAPGTTTTTAAPGGTTTTTAAPGGTTTTTAPSATTTTAAPGGTTSTTAAPGSTTTTSLAPGATTSTTAAGTTTTTAAGATTTTLLAGGTTTTVARAATTTTLATGTTTTLGSGAAATTTSAAAGLVAGGQAGAADGSTGPSGVTVGASDTRRSTGASTLVTLPRTGTEVLATFLFALLFLALGSFAFAARDLTGER